MNPKHSMKTLAPEELGLSTTRLNRINRVMQRYVDEQKLAGIVTLVARHGAIAHFEAFGLRDLEANQPMQLDSIFRIYSMTKPIVSVAVMMLYEAGGFHLNDPVSKFIPAFKDLKVLVKPDYEGLKLAEPEPEMTIRNLLTHTAGLTYGFFEDSPVEAMYREAELLNRDITLEDMIQKLAAIPLIYQPGRAWRYSVATDVLGYLVEVFSGQSLDRFLAENIFHPLGMTDTAFYVPEEKLPRFATNYGPAESGGLEVIDPPATSPYAKPPCRFSGGGGLVSTATDYLRFCQMLLNQGELNGTRLLGRKTIALMTANHLPDDLMPIQIGPNFLHGYGFGLGFRVLLDVAQAGILGSVGEYGWGGAANTYFWIDPQEDLIGILMTQFMPSGHHPVSPDFRVLAYQALVD